MVPSPRWIDASGWRCPRAGETAQRGRVCAYAQTERVCYAPAMKDHRIKVFRGAIEALLESLDAYVRVARWSEPGGIPEPLNTAATKLVDRLGTADRLASGVFIGSPADSNKVTAMCVAMKRLDAAYVAYRHRVDRMPEQEATASATLEAEIGEIRGNAHQWR